MQLRISLAAVCSLLSTICGGCAADIADEAARTTEKQNRPTGRPWAHINIVDCTDKTTGCVYVAHRTYFSEEDFNAAGGDGEVCENVIAESYLRTDFYCHQWKYPLFGDHVYHGPENECKRIGPNHGRVYFWQGNDPVASQQYLSLKLCKDILRGCRAWARESENRSCYTVYDPGNAIRCKSNCKPAG